MGTTLSLTKEIVAKEIDLVGQIFEDF